MEHISIGNLIIIGLIAGIFGTSAMSIFLNLISKSGYANADMIRALGSLFTKSMNNAFQVGLALHMISGIIFAFIYTFIMMALNIHGFTACLGAGLIIGFIHGAVVSFLLVATVAENHPLPQFQTAGFSVAVAHWAGHIVYGVVVGIVIGIIGY
jgi:uncharacterized membrane protein YeaQ/YmgE (transglycosylase-associated protein family)